jgi:hypothetical protein
LGIFCLKNGIVLKIFNLYGKIEENGEKFKAKSATIAALKGV